MDFRRDREIILTFISETKEHLSEIEAGLLEMEKCPDDLDGELLHTMFRAAHTIKAGANLLDRQDIESLSHELEDILNLLRQGKISLGDDIADAFLKGIDKIREIVDDYQHSRRSTVSSLVNRLKRIRILRRH